MRITPAFILVCFVLAVLAPGGDTAAHPRTASELEQESKSSSPLMVEDGWIRMRIDLVELPREGDIKILNTRLIDGLQGQWSEHHLHFKSSLSTKQLSARFRVLATMLSKQGVQLDLGFRLVPQMENFQNAMVIIRSRESAVLEFLENRNTGTRIAFRVTPIEVGRVVSASATRGHHPVKEEVMIRWWVVPAFAVDNKNRPVSDLEKKDVTLILDNKPVHRFRLYKKEYNFSRSSTIRRFHPNRRVVFLVFDNFFTSHILVERSKSIARSLVSRSENGNHYVLMSLEYGSGLKYIVGPTNHKEAVLKAIKELKPTYMTFLRRGQGGRGIEHQESEWDKPYSPWQDVVDQSNKDNYRSDYKKRERARRENDPSAAVMEDKSERQDGGEDEQARLPQDYGREKFMVQAFIRGLRTLDTAMGSLEDSSRVVYVFSSGIADKSLYRRISSNISIDTFHYDQLQRIGEVFSRNGVMLFVVNPEGHRVTVTNPESGETALRVLANASGGRYFEGTKETVTENILNMDRAFYEIAFPDTSPYKNPNIKDFRVKVRRKGVHVYTVRKVTHGREYSQLKSFEKEILVLNAIEGGYLAKIKLKTRAFPLRLLKRTGNRLIYRFDLPKQLRRTECDVYKVWINPKASDVIMEMEAVLTAGDYLDVEIAKREHFAHYIVIIHPRTQAAYIGR